MTASVDEVADDGVRWFGQSWSAPINRGDHQVPVPVGDPCGAGDGPIAEGDQGVQVLHVGSGPEWMAWHLQCFLGALGLTDGPPA